MSVTVPLAVDPQPDLPGTVTSTVDARGWLESPWVGIVFTLLLLVAVVLLIRAIRRRRRPVRLVAAGAGVLLAAVFTVAAWANAYAGYVPDSTAAQRMVGLTSNRHAASGVGTVREFHLGAPKLRIPSSAVWVYLPPGYDRPGNTTSYPVVYLLHGFPGRSVDWFSAGRIDSTMNALIDSGVLPAAIVVAPDMNAANVVKDTEGMNLPRGPQVQTYLTSTVPTWADATFRTRRQWRDRIIGGMSAGGYVALNLGLLYQSEFGAILALEPYGNPGPSTLPELHGDKAYYASQSPDKYLPTMTFTHPVPTFLDEGAKVTGTDAPHLRDLLVHRSQPVLFRLEPGQAHTWTEARLGIAYGLVWAAGQLHWTAG